MEHHVDSDGAGSSCSDRAHEAALNQVRSVCVRDPDLNLIEISERVTSPGS
jgi:hypothetical protein